MNRILDKVAHVISGIIMAIVVISAVGLLGMGYKTVANFLGATPWSLTVCIIVLAPLILLFPDEDDEEGEI